jgi:hypothetical protein
MRRFISISETDASTKLEENTNQWLVAPLQGSASILGNATYFAQNLQNFGGGRSLREKKGPLEPGEIGGKV